jgi:medium-chain acyl-[acyl-carrier-protein] hydrolase
MNEPITLFLLPFAGGSSYSYKEFAKYESDKLKLSPLELPGRGKRIRESLKTNVHELVDDIFAQICTKLDKPYMIYGHSMGTLLTYLLTKKIIKHGLNPPLWLFLTGSVGPSVIENRKTKYHQLPASEFMDRVKLLGGLPDEILSHPELLDFYLPILRADFEVVETYQYRPTVPFDIPMDVTIGTEDEATFEEAEMWQLETIEPLRLKQYKGNHFFIYQHIDKIMDNILGRVELLSRMEYSV